MKRIAFLFLAILMIFPAVTVWADELPLLPAEHGVLSLSTASAGPGGSFEIDLILEENPGITTFSAEIFYDDTKLRLEEVKNGTVFKPTEFNPDKATPYLVAWIRDGEENLTATGVLCTLRFTVKPDATAGTAAVSATFKDAYDTDFAPVAFYSAETEITILEVAPGDLDGNKAVNSADAIYLLYHTLFGNSRYPVSGNADYDKNGAVNSADAIYLLYHTLFGSGRYPLS
jgi:hypothetical protein